MSRATPDDFVSIRVACANAEWREIASATGFEAGVEGAVEEGDASLILYCPAGAASRVEAAITEAIAEHGTVSTGVPVEARAWSEEWKRHLSIVEVSPHLRIRPTVLEAPLPTGQAEVRIDPGQAFGIGGHASTRLALEWVDILARDDRERGRSGEWLDVGTGTGVLALAALALGAPRATGCDNDPLATRAAREAAQANGVAKRFDIVDSLDDVRSEPRFERVVANLLKREVLPLCDAIAARTRGAGEQGASGRIVLSGLLDRDEAEVCQAFARHGIARVARREHRDADGELWVGLLLAPSLIRG